MYQLLTSPSNIIFGCLAGFILNFYNLLDYCIILYYNYRMVEQIIYFIFNSICYKEIWWFVDLFI